MTPGKAVWAAASELSVLESRLFPKRDIAGPVRGNLSRLWYVTYEEQAFPSVRWAEQNVRPDSGAVVLVLEHFQIGTLQWRVFQTRISDMRVRLDQVSVYVEAASAFLVELAMLVLNGMATGMRKS